MPECPICFLVLKLDEAEFAAHVNYHFEHEGNEVSYHDPDDSGFGNSHLGGAYSGGSERAARHVGGHGGSANSSNSQWQVPAGLASCFVCGLNLAYLPTEVAKQAHANACLDGADLADDQAGSGWTTDPFATGGGTSSDGGWDDQERHSKNRGESSLSNLTASSTLRSKGDSWWSPDISPLSSLPINYSPSIIPILHQILLQTHAQTPQVTRSAVLSHPATCHVKAVWGFDIGWGCGYRNFLMGLSTVLSVREDYRDAFGIKRGAEGVTDPESPGVRNLQLWMAQGWNEGYDPTGREQFKNKIVGTKNWIGTSDMYVVLTRKGIPCQLYDFPKATGGKWHSSTNTHVALVQWVTAYFDAAEGSGSSSRAASEKLPPPSSAFDVLMRSGTEKSANRSIRITQKMPLILQHAGHSRTIVGYEINAQGSTNLLMFDPNGGITAELRQSGIDHLQAEQEKQSRGWEPFPGSGPSGSAHTAQKRRSESPHDEMVSKKREDDRSGSTTGLKTWLGNGTSTSAGQSKQRDWERKPVKALGIFRVNLGSLSRNSAYQILAFTGAPLLTESEKRSKRIVSSIQILE